MPDFTVERFGTDSSGRPIYMTRYQHNWWEYVCVELGFRPTIVQGAWMTKVEGGGASDSAGYHDGGGCLDLRVWDLTETQQAAVIHATRWSGAGSWIRDAEHGGMDPHIHLVLGSDDGLSPGASWQWLNYINGGDGIGGRDYHPRPTPLVLTPPERDWFDMATKDELRDLLVEVVRKPVLARMNTIADNSRERDQAENALIDQLIDALASHDEKEAHRFRLIRNELKAADADPVEP